MRFIVEGTLPGLNDIVSSSRTSKFKGNIEKRKAQEMVCKYIGLHKRITCSKPVEVVLTFYEPNNRRDCDNVIGGGSKVILDALKDMGVIVDDSRKYVKQVHGLVYTDKGFPRIEIEVIDP